MSCCFTTLTWPKQHDEAVRELAGGSLHSVFTTVLSGADETTGEQEYALCGLEDFRAELRGACIPYRGHSNADDTSRDAEDFRWEPGMEDEEVFPSSFNQDVVRLIDGIPDPAHLRFLAGYRQIWRTDRYRANLLASAQLCGKLLEERGCSE